MTNEEYLLIGLAFISGMFTGATLTYHWLSKINRGSNGKQ